MWVDLNEIRCFQNILNSRDKLQTSIIIIIIIIIIYVHRQN